MNAYSGPPMILGNAAAARVRLIVWCLDCHHQVEPDPAEMAERYGAEMSVPDWHARLCLRPVWQPAGRFRRYRRAAFLNRGSREHLTSRYPRPGATWLRQTTDDREFFDGQHR
jgi:hypothetical protein